MTVAQRKLKSIALKNRRKTSEELKVEIAECGVDTSVLTLEEMGCRSRIPRKISRG